MNGPTHPERVDIYAAPTNPPVYTHEHGGRLCACRTLPAPEYRAADPERLDVHAALNTYETVDTEPGFRLDGPQADVVGANARRLILRETEDGLYVGGCLIKDKATAYELAAFVKDWADNTAGWAV